MQLKEKEKERDDLLEEEKVLNRQFKTYTERLMSVRDLMDGQKKRMSEHKVWINPHPQMYPC
mgnify:CR=1 FL=1